MRLIDADALKEDFESRLALCYKWVEKAKDEETKIRADATKHFICEVIMTIDNIPTVEPTFREVVAYECGQKLVESPHDERAKRALAIIDRLRTNGHINNKEQGSLRRAILLPERPTGEWLYDDIINNWKCSKCGETPKTIGYVGTAKFMHDEFKFCNHCGAYMIKEENND